MGLGDFFRDYGTPFALAVAVLNGFIAVLIAQLFPDYPIAKVTKPAPLDQTNDWANRVETFLSTQLGQSYVNRFRDSTGTPPAQMPVSGADSEHQNVWAQIYFRVLRLEQFSQQLPL